MEITPEFDILALPFQGHATTITKIEYNPHTNEIISGGMDGSIRIWNAETKKQKAVFTAHKDHISQLIVLPNKNQLISSSWDGKIMLWNLEKNKLVRVIQDFKKPIHAMSFSSNKNHLLISIEGRQTKIIDIEQGKQILSLKGHKDEVSVLSYSPDEKLFASGSWDKTVKIWNEESKKPLNTITLENEVSALNFIENNKIIIGTWGGNVILYDINRNTISSKIKTHHNIVSQILFDKKNNQVITASADKTIKILDPSNLEEKYSLEEHSSRIFSIAQSTEYLFSTGADKKIIIWNKNTWKKKDEITGRDNTVFQALLTPTAEYAQILDSSGNEIFVDLKTLEKVPKPNVPFYSKEKLDAITPRILAHDGVSITFRLDKLTNEQAKLAYVALKTTLDKKFWAQIDKEIFVDLSQNTDIQKEYNEKVDALLEAIKQKTE